MTDKLSASLLPQLKQISAARWNALTNDEVLLSHEFLSALEESGSVCARTGWQPCHLILEQGKDLIAAMPLYLKGHSQGEYIFDHGWADALARVDLDYYPKLVSCVPFTPVTGSRFLGEPLHHAALFAAAQQMMPQLKASSLHINFLPQDQWQWTNKIPNALQRTHFQFHWHNQGYDSFEDFLTQMSSRHRKNIRKERKRAQEGLTIKRFTGAALTESLWDSFFTFYTDTGARKWGYPYLTREAFSLLGQRLADRILLLLAFDGERPIAGALNFMDRTKLYGRYWGCTEYRDCLHFELSYYQAIDFAIEQKMKIVEAGAQGEHKLDRGYVPVKTYSAHSIAHAELADAVEQFLSHESKSVDASMDYLNKATPFKKNTL